MKINKRILSVLLAFAFVIGCISFAPLQGIAAKEDKVIMVSLGDSYSSGEGIEPFFGQEKETKEKVSDQDWLAHRSQKAWSGLLKVDGVSGTMADNKDTNWFFVAASGAEIKDLTSGQTKAYNKDGINGTFTLDPQLDVFDQLEKGSVDYVTLTLGGNDVGFTELITSAVMNNEERVQSDIEAIWKKFFAENGIRASLKEAYKKIADKAGSQAKIIVAGYPKLLNPDGFAINYFVDVDVSAEKTKIVNDSTIKFNSEIEKLVEECRNEGMNIYFVDVVKEFDGHEAYTSEPYINEVITTIQPEDINDKGFVSSYSVHPNAEGAKAYARAIQKAIDSFGKGETETAKKVVTVTNSALKKAKTNIGLYLGGVLLSEKAFKVNGKIDGKKSAVYYIPAKTVTEALGGKYKVKSKKVTVTLGTVTLTFKQGKNSYAVSFKDESGKKQKVTLQYGKNVEKNGQTYIPASIVEEISALTGKSVSASLKKSKLYIE